MVKTLAIGIGAVLAYKYSSKIPFVPTTGTLGAVAPLAVAGAAALLVGKLL